VRQFARVRGELAVPNILIANVRYIGTQWPCRDV